MTSFDQERLRQEYKRRNLEGDNNLYSLFNISHLRMKYQRQRSTINLLRKAQITNFVNKKFLEVGCGRGDILAELMAFRLLPQQIVGIDLLFDSTNFAHARYPHLLVAQADGQRLPFADTSFDFVLQYTAFSSILDMNIKQSIATEMKRVLKPDGSIIWYDFWLNPTNPQTRGIRPHEIKSLFGNCTYLFKKTTLAPPLNRRLASNFPAIADLLESLTIFNTHYLCIIQPSQSV